MEYSRKTRIILVTLVGVVVNLLLSVVKITAGRIGQSTALVSDGIHSMGDFLSDLVVIIFVFFSVSGVEAQHKRIRGKLETIATMLVALILFFAAIEMIMEAITDFEILYGGGTLETPTMLALCVALCSIVAKELVYQYTVRRGRALDSSVLVANAWHHRADSLASVGSSIGIAATIFLGEKFAFMDGLAACIIAIFIIVSAVRIFAGAVKELKG